jgi:hypothetical protein
MTPEALALHFIDDLDSKINQLRTLRENSPGMQFHRGFGRFVYLPPQEERPAEPLLDLVEPHAQEALEAELPEGEVEVQPPLFEMATGDEFPG